MESRIEQALDRHKHGHNCAQAVICTYCDLVGMDENIAFQVSEGFGRGFGGANSGVCGAVSGLCMLVGLSDSRIDIEKGKTKQQTYRDIKALCTQFEEMNGSIVCRDLLGLGSPGVKRSCNGCIVDAAKLIESFLEQQEAHE